MRKFSGSDTRSWQVKRKEILYPSASPSIDVYLFIYQNSLDELLIPPSLPSLVILDYDRLIAKIEEGEQKILKQQEIQEQLKTKLNKYRLPLQQMKITYHQNKGKNYTEDEDRFLVRMLFSQGCDLNFPGIRFRIGIRIRICS